VEVPATSAEAPKRPGLTVPETRTTQVIQATVAQNRLSVRACYEKALAVDAKLRGTLTVHFTIDEAGVVTSAEVNTQRTTLSEPGVQQCALAAVKKITFPKSSRGFESTVNYPFDFRPRY
jgi:TonB family protein